MASDWINPCGVRYRTHDDGRIEVEGLGFPAYELTGATAQRLAKIWSDWGPGIMAAVAKHSFPPAWAVGIINIESGGDPKAGAPCNEICSAYWKAGQCAAQGGPITICAGGLMAFTGSTAQMYGHDLQWYVDHPNEMIADAMDLLLHKKSWSAGLLGAVKGYNGGSACAGNRDPSDMNPGILGMYGQGNYIEKFVKSVNTFVALGLAAPSPAASGMPSNVQAAVVIALAAAVLTLAVDRYANISGKIATRVRFA